MIPPAPTEEHIRQKLSQLAHEQTGQRIAPTEWTPICAGASGRSLMRAQGLVGVFWTNQRADNNSFLPAAHALRAAGLNAPSILAQWQNAGHSLGACLLPDLGSQDLLSLKESSAAERRQAVKLCFQALGQLAQLQATWPLQPSFDEELYRWEQSYFAEHYLGQHCQRSDWAQFLQQEPLQELARKLAQEPRSLVHRDFQSQNIMLHEGKAWLIDFQGMRLGLPEYDLASLLFDPYMDWCEQERTQLLSEWQQMQASPLCLPRFVGCAAQRLMQALGAYANIGYNMGKVWYLEQIPPAQRALRAALRMIPPTQLHASILSWLPPNAP